MVLFTDQVLSAADIDIPPFCSPVAFKLEITGAVTPDFYSGAMSVSNPLAISSVMLEAVTVVIKRTVDVFG